MAANQLTKYHGLRTISLHPLDLSILRRVLPQKLWSLALHLPNFYKFVMLRVRSSGNPVRRYALSKRQSRHALRA